MGSPLWVKICANTNLADVSHALTLGADAVGFVFAPSKRQVTPAQVRQITGHLASPRDNPAELVGVFAPDEALYSVAYTVEHARLTTVQLHGGVDLERSTQLRALLPPHIALIHVIPWAIDEQHLQDSPAEHEVRRQLTLLSTHSSSRDSPPERVLLDAKLGSASGGLGLAFPWDRARTLLLDFPRLPVIVAGGLHPGNVAQAIATLAPVGVDVASGVEASPGRKDPAKVQAFIENARRA